MLFTACTLVTAVAPFGSRADQAAAPAGAQPVADANTHGTVTPARVDLGLQYAQSTTIQTPGGALPQSESVRVKYKRLLVKEKDSPSAVTELGSKQISSVGVSGSPGSILRQAPSVYVYQQGIGDNAPELTVRGTRGLEIATTLDGVPTQDLLAPGSFYLGNNLGGLFTLNQIDGVHIYPGVAYPDKQTFGTIGGTIAYDSKRPTPDRYLDVVGEIGSFGTYKEGFEANSGRLDGPFGTGDNAPMVLLNYYNQQSQGFIDDTPERENEMEFAFDKPYQDGLSKFQATVIYNNAVGLIENEPVPTAYLNLNGRFSSYPSYLDFAQQKNDFLTIILKNDTYVNDNLTLGLTTFFLKNDNQLEDYANINVLTPAGVPNQLTVGNTNPFINNQGGFGYGGFYGPPTNSPIGIFSTFNGTGNGYGGYFYNPARPYNPYALYASGSTACPTSVINNFGGRAFAPCGLNDQINGGSTYTYGIQPRATIIAPELFGIDNTIKIGGLAAKETADSGYGYLGAFPQTPFDPQNQSNVFDGGNQRTIFQGYAQDKIDALGNTLHITPGVTLEGTYSSFTGANVFQSKSAPGYGPNGYFSGLGTNIDQYGPYSAQKWDREWLPFANVSYDFDRILPAAKGLTAYGSYGTSALFAPVTDFGPNTNQQVPYASIVHLYEGGVKYNVSNLSLSADYYYQKVTRDFGFYSSQTGATAGQTVYNNNGGREFKGQEASAIYQLTPDWQIFGNVSHQLAKYSENSFAFTTVSQDQYGIGVKGTPISGVPDWLSTFGADYTKSNLMRDGDLLHLRLTGEYTGHQYTTFDLQGASQVFGYGYAFQKAGVPGIDYASKNTVFNTFTGATLTNTNGGGISPFAIFNLDASYKMPTPQLPVLKSITFDVNIQNLFDERYFQYFYQQVSPSVCKVTPNNPTGNQYGCTPVLNDAIPGQPFSIFFTVTARF